MSNSGSTIALTRRTLDRASVLTAVGKLDSTTYRELRDAVIKSALDEPSAVIVDVAALEVPSESAWSVFTSARWHVSVWPDIPVILVCRHQWGRDAIARNGITRYVAMYPTLESAVEGIHDDSADTPRRRARAQLPAVHSSMSRARRLVAEWLQAWSHSEMIAVATLIVDVLVENVLEHTQSAPSLIVESRGTTLTIAVEDTSRAAATRREHPGHGGDTTSGLAVLAAVSRTWGSTPTSTGKTVWAVIGPESSL
ncbi:STAS domain-containing protein [Mycolicibacterium porcinum]|uniref:STAS domain-containing protein n=1 Tax=Mycolicibacterium porcinum TaxID=39693 RepID=UPI0008491F27|nr:STAS domain-containing protein [Mycolicibacterium porcinum]ODR26156.1 sulfate transporter [Mycolicibacterium porcinum]